LGRGLWSIVVEVGEKREELIVQEDVKVCERKV
jgi:hypothetical protein